MLIYYVENHLIFADAAVRAFDQLSAAQFVISPLVKFECLDGALKRNNPSLVRQYRKFFERFGNLEMHESVYLDAAELRARFEQKRRMLCT